MNKKKYITPIVNCIDIDCESIIADSLIYSGGDDGGYGEPEAPIRRGSDWDNYFNP